MGKRDSALNIKIAYTQRAGNLFTTRFVNEPKKNIPHGSTVSYIMLE